MKIERLYAITVYLLNHGKTSARSLAEYFEVSTRTIQRDIDSLCIAGIPVISTEGATGGYEISDRFALEKGFATRGDYSYILTALQGLVSASGDPGARRTLEKIAQVSEPDSQSTILDFSVLKETDQAALQLLQTAIAQKRAVTFTYTNNDNETRPHCVEPVAVLYRWYAWYLLAYSNAKQDYRTYKLVRMRAPAITDTPFAKEHPPAHAILRETDQTDSRQYTELLVRCSASARARLTEYLGGTIVEEYADGCALMRATVVENEHLWFGTLLSLGDQAEVLSPAHIRRRVLESAEKLVSLYRV
ncbi:MAG: YafY family transcriptional regulator [Lachnospiraceae bacterium]|nr:YafY family transcriptional regulator [Lachnospiraceae bacterium]